MQGAMIDTTNGEEDKPGLCAQRESLEEEAEKQLGNIQRMTGE